MTSLIDTDVVVSYLIGRGDAVTLLQQLVADGIAVSVITYGEIYEGIYAGADPTRHEASFRAFLRGARVIVVNRTVARRFGQLRSALRRQSQILPAPDLLIAATALTYDLVLVTRNLRHFQRIPGLRVY